jgi:hypothetical protein
LSTTAPTAFTTTQLGSKLHKDFTRRNPSHDPGSDFFKALLGFGKPELLPMQAGATQKTQFATQARYAAREGKC